jgi:hypothetical protein
MKIQFQTAPAVDDARHHPREMLIRVQQLLAGGATLRPDPRRENFYELEHGNDIFYIHVSPVTHRVLLLAAWAKSDSEAAAYFVSSAVA